MVRHAAREVAWVDDDPRALGHDESRGIGDKATAHAHTPTSIARHEAELGNRAIERDAVVCHRG
jgi:hypothetical protein